ncbi:hypothetical protein [uncultured Croceitalea sp.]|uniref:hypothetical protein n=1 Tax=uncultured Croceitalea sp. TaxID=1798908 RepID=UPI0033059C96
MKVISSHEFKHILKDIHKNSESRKFCFILGAGASYNSGIPTGSELARQWFSEIEQRMLKSELKKWMNENKIDSKNLGAAYGNIYRKRFENDKTSGYESLVQVMKKAKPTFGHIVLAQVLSTIPGHCVLTTNFDSLVESAVYQFTNKTPLVCGHESLSGYARPSNIHPLIIKVHRDLLLNPKSTPEEIHQLASGWYEPLDTIFGTHIPIVIGYGGNDGSLMSYFENMKKPSNFFWCGRTENSTSPHVKELITKLDGRFVKIKGFDELMYELLPVFDEIKPLGEELNDITKNRVSIATKKLEELSAFEDEQLANSTENDIEKELSALEYDNMAEKEPDFEKRKEIYLEALQHYPKTGWLWNAFTYFLHFVKKDYQNLEKYYLKAIDMDSKDAYNHANYAIFLQYIKKDYSRAQRYYLQALDLDSDDANINGNYANYLKDVKKEYSESEKYFRESLRLEPERPNHNGNYAQLLLMTGKKDEATEYLEKAFRFNGDRKMALLIELWFYRYAHYPEYLLEAEQKIEELLEESVRSVGWDFSQNIKAAIKENHPNQKKLKEFAKQITTAK